MHELIFITSNSAKLSHAKHLCQKYALRIVKQKNYGIGYNEPILEDRNELLKLSIEDAILRFRKTVPDSSNQVFFIEDTSVIIRCLSNEKEMPGVNVKYWMREMDFLKLDTLLKKHGNDRSVVVRSDVVLALNNSLSIKFNCEYLTFTSFVKGTICTEEYKIQTNALYPWLSGNTFNKWFIPEGCSYPLSMLPIADADHNDFRSGAISEMLNFLHKEGLIKTKTQYSKEGKQTQLFEPTIFIVSGPTCAGKTTLATYLQSKFNYYHLEASDFMHLSYYDRHGFNSSVPIGDFAQKALAQNPSIVSDQIIQNIQDISNIPLLITGFRSPKEIEIFTEKYQGRLSVEIIYINADLSIRFNRCIERARNDFQAEVKAFKTKDEQQYTMGLSIIEDKYINDSIINNGTLDEFYAAFNSKYQSQLNVVEGNSALNVPSYFKSKSLQNAIIIALMNNNTGKYYTTTEISHLINNDSNGYSAKNKNNISRYFNQHFYPYFEISLNNSKATCYRLSQTGLSYARWIQRNPSRL